MSRTNSAPEYPAILKPIPRTRDKPMPNRPNINSQSIKGFPARIWKNGATAPFTPNVKNPAVGETPCSQDLSDVVANPNPKNLSINAQKKINPSAILNNENRISIFFISLGYYSL